MGPGIHSHEFVGLNDSSFRSMLSRVKVIATDIDGTLTHQGTFPGALVSMLEHLKNCGVEVILVTGRSAGWVHALGSYLPVAGAMAENGGVFFGASLCQEEVEPLVLSHGLGANQAKVNGADANRSDLKRAFERLQELHPHLRVTVDNAFRLTDWTFDVRGVAAQVLADACGLAQAEGLEFTYSTIHGHFMPQGQNKAAGLQHVLRKIPRFAGVSTSEVLTVGDSPNDETLFEAKVFPVSAGVANLASFASRMRFVPRALSSASEAFGFLEIATALLEARGQSLS